MNKIYYAVLIIMSGVINGLYAADGAAANNAAAIVRLAHAIKAVGLRRGSEGFATRVDKKLGKPSSLAVVSEGDGAKVTSDGDTSKAVHKASIKGEVPVRRHLALLPAHVPQMVATATAAKDDTDAGSATSDLTSFEERARRIAILRAQVARRSTPGPTDDEYAAEQQKRAFAAAQSRDDIERMVNTAGTLTDINSFTDFFIKLGEVKPEKLPNFKVLTDSIKGMGQSYFGYNNNTSKADKNSKINSRLNNPLKPIKLVDREKCYDAVQALITRFDKQPTAKEFVSALRGSGLLSLKVEATPSAAEQEAARKKLDSISARFEALRSVIDAKACATATTPAAAGGTE